MFILFHRRLMIHITSTVK